MTENCFALHEKIQAYHSSIRGEHHRYRSWEHCYRYFHATPGARIAADRDHAALQLGFYLASWGMYRGSTFLLQHTYTIHIGVIDQLIKPQFAPLWQHEFGADSNDKQYIQLIVDAADAIRESYRQSLASAAKSPQATDTLVTKILLGTFGCLPALDQYFISGFRTQGFRYSGLNAKTIGQLLDFCQANLHGLRAEQESIKLSNGVCYPLMKLVDMYFWQIGCERDTSKRAGEFSPSG